MEDGIVVVGLQIGRVVEVAGGHGACYSLLLVGRHERDKSLLLMAPQLTRGGGAREDYRLDALGVSVYHVGEDEHAAPRLPEEVHPIEVQMAAQGLELVEPCGQRPQLWMSVDIALATSNLVVAYNLSARGDGKVVEHLKIIVRRARTAVDEQQRGIVGGFADDSVICLIALEGHRSCCNLH